MLKPKPRKFRCYSLSYCAHKCSKLKFYIPDYQKKKNSQTITNINSLITKKKKSLKICNLLYRGITFLKYVLIIHIICYYYLSYFCLISRHLHTSPSPWLHILNYLCTATCWDFEIQKPTFQMFKLHQQATTSIQKQERKALTSPYFPYCDVYSN